MSKYEIDTNMKDILYYSEKSVKLEAIGLIKQGIDDQYDENPPFGNDAKIIELLNQVEKLLK